VRPKYQWAHVSACLIVSLSSVGGDRTVADSLASTRDIQSSRLKPVPSSSTVEFALTAAMGLPCMLSHLGYVQKGFACNAADVTSFLTPSHVRFQVGECSLARKPSIRVLSITSHAHLQFTGLYLTIAPNKVHNLDAGDWLEITVRKGLPRPSYRIRNIHAAHHDGIQTRQSVVERGTTFLPTARTSDKVLGAERWIWWSAVGFVVYAPVRDMAFMWVEGYCTFQRIL